MLQNIIFSLDFCYFKDISDKVTANNDVTCMMMSSVICCVYYHLEFFVTELKYCITHKILNYCSIILIRYHSKADENENFFMQTQLISRNSRKSHIFELGHH